MKEHRVSNGNILHLCVEVEGQDGKKSLRTVASATWEELENGKRKVRVIQRFPFDQHRIGAIKRIVEKDSRGRFVNNFPLPWGPEGPSQASTDRPIQSTEQLFGFISHSKRCRRFTV